MAGPRKLPLLDAEVLYFEDFFARPRADALFRVLMEGIEWKQERIRLFGKEIDIPRLSAWHGDEGATYRYSGLTIHPMPWTDTLLEIKREVEPACGVIFNSVLLNLYRNERDSVAWHSDDESELGRNPVIGSVSLGESRLFQLRHKQDRRRKFAVELTHGSLLLMRGPTQHHWVHQVPKASSVKGPRMNLTFRVIQ